MRRVLLIDDDRMQFRLTEAHFKNFRQEQFVLEWASTYEEGLAKLLEGGYAACLLDYQLGPRDGLALIRDAAKAECRVPIIFLTAETGESVDIQAMNAGALDYLVKGEINTRTLERSLRYALKLGETLEALRRLATHDALTGVLNRREFDRVLAAEIERFLRFGHPLAILLLDLDHFKAVNDTHGHQAGDEVLKAVAMRLGTELRSVDRLARFGGEEFAVLLPETSDTAAHSVAQRLVATVGRAPVILPNGTGLPVTISAGSAGFPGYTGDATALVLAADKALYAAKAAGRNRAEAAAR